MPIKVNLTIWNPTSAPVDVLCYCLTGNDITIPAFSFVDNEIEVYEYITKVYLFGFGRYYTGLPTTIVTINSSNTNVIMEPNLSWIAVHNMTQSTLERVAYSKDESPVNSVRYSYWDSLGKYSKETTILPLKTKYIKIYKEDMDGIKEGYITCWSGDKEYITYKTIKTPNPGCEVNVYLYPSGLEEVIYR